MDQPPSPRGGSVHSIPIPAYSPLDTQFNAIAGPSSEGAICRRSDELDASSQPLSPSSAPSIPSAISVTHPPQFIHTHHPRRGSLTPLGLNIISPVPPQALRERENINPTRNVGFHPNYSPKQSFLATATAFNAGAPSSAGLQQSNRRSSAASTASRLSLSRPPIAHASHSFCPLNQHPGRRRSSLTPSISTLAPPSPTHTHANGISFRPTSNDEGRHPAHADSAIGFLELMNKGGNYVRRGSLPHIGHRGWAGHSQRVWNPILPPPRGSVGKDDSGELPIENFRFGSGISSTISTPRSVSQLGSDRRPSESKRREDMSVFEQAEAEEAERQRRAFLAATYGADGRRARERLSIGGQSINSGQGKGLRRQSLMLWESMGMFRGSGDESAVSAPVGPSRSANATGLLSGEDEVPLRRGSLPVAIPGTLERSASRRQKKEANGGKERSKSGDEDAAAYEEDDERRGGIGESLSPLRPLPPLLPLSDPGPRLLPSTLALHRANHLLNSRNLQSDPLPPPLPPSLHPPDPVDVTEFDIDFILSGSQTQLGQNLAGDASADAVDAHGVPLAQTLKLGGEEEDSFAKFVGENDDEYGDRRGEWTFRACPTPSKKGASQLVPKAEWESLGAGKYELFHNDEVRSSVTGRVWRVKKLGAREYELEEVRPSGLVVPNKTEKAERLTLAGKAVHRDQGGVKLPSFNVNAFFPPFVNPTSRSPAAMHRNGPAGKLRASMSEGFPASGKSKSPLMPTGYSEGEDFTNTTNSLSQSMPFTSAMSVLKAKKKDERSREVKDDVFAVGVSTSGKKLLRDGNKESEGEKKDRSIGGVLKRGLSNLKNSGLVGTSSSEERRLAREERERERVQAHSWNGSSSPNGYQSWNPHSQYALEAIKDYHPTHPRLMKGDEMKGLWQEERRVIKWIEGNAWGGVPEDAVAMIIPLEGDNSAPDTPFSPTPPSPSSETAKDLNALLKSYDNTVIPHPFFSSGTKRALLVWYVPFNSDLDGESRPSTAFQSSNSISSTNSNASANDSSPPGSLPKFQKLLRKRASKDKETMKRELAQGSNWARPTDEVRPLKRHVSSTQALPFRSFRVVARVVDCKELKSKLEGREDDEQRVNGGGIEWSKGGNVFAESSAVDHPSTTSATDPAIPPFLRESFSTDNSSRPLTGRNFPTVIAVCHSRSQGVEFVLEGLDRLGLCKGESAWGPTGYEEWRGTGLSEHGRKMLDLLWAGCTGVMGLIGV